MLSTFNFPLLTSSMSLFSKNESYLGVDIGAHGIKLVELKKTKNRSQLWTYGIAEQTLDIHLPEVKDKTPEELISDGKTTPFDNGMGEDAPKKKKKNDELPELSDPRINKYAKLLKELAREANVSTKLATASLPVSYVFHTVLNLPVVEDKKLEKVVRAEVEKFLPKPIDEMQIVHQKIPDKINPENPKEKKQNMSVLVTAAPKVLIQFYSNIFSKAGLQLQELETEAFALERSLVGIDRSTAMIVDIGSERTNFFIIDQGLPLVHRSISQGGMMINKIIAKELSVEMDIAEQIKKDLSNLKPGSDVLDTEIFKPILDSILKEIKYSFDMFLSQSGNEDKRPEKIIFTGGTSLLPFFVSEAKKQFNMRAFVGDPWARVVYQQGLKQVLDDIAPRMSVSIGLAMRNIIK